MRDKNYYNVQNDLAQSLGTIGSISEAVVMVIELFIGLIFDVFGRKIPLVFGFILIGLGLIGIPLFK